MQATLISYYQTQRWYTLGAQVIARNKQNTPWDSHFGGKEGSLTSCVRWVSNMWLLSAFISWGTKCQRSMIFSRKRRWNQGPKHPMATEVGLGWKETEWTRWVEKETFALKIHWFICWFYGLKLVQKYSIHLGFKIECPHIIYISAHYSPTLNINT